MLAAAEAEASEVKVDGARVAMEVVTARVAMVVATAAAMTDTVETMITTVVATEATADMTTVDTEAQALAESTEVAAAKTRGTSPIKDTNFLSTAMPLAS